MSKFIIQGGRRLEGEVKISGSKNAALPIIAATVLNGGKTTLYNIPDIQDVQTMFEIIKDRTDIKDIDIHTFHVLTYSLYTLFKKFTTTLKSLFILLNKYLQNNCLSVKITYVVSLI